MKASKFKVFTAHLAISGLIFLVLCWFVVFRWFVDDLFFIDGGWQGLRIIAGVDLVLGPMLTLIFYKPGKPNVVFDLSVIAVVQTLALGYGVWSAYSQANVAVAFVEGRFVSVARNALNEGDAAMRAIGKPTQSLDAITEQRPAQLWVVPITEHNEYGQYLVDVLNGKPELQERSHRFRKLSAHIDDILEFELSLDSLLQQNPKLHEKVVGYFQAKKLDPGLFYLFKLQARYGKGLAIASRDAGSIEHIMAIPDDLI